MKYFNYAKIEKCEHIFIFYFFGKDTANNLTEADGILFTMSKMFCCW